MFTLNPQSNISPESKMRKPDRILKLKVIEGKKAIDSGMAPDARLFKDGPDANRLHITMDLETSLWSIHYEKGNIPSNLQGNFTTFAKAKEHADRYFALRNIVVTQVID